MEKLAESLTVLDYNRTEMEYSGFDYPAEDHWLGTNNAKNVTLNSSGFVTLHRHVRSRLQQPRYFYAHKD